MIVKPDWNIFKVNFPENPQKNFEWMCYQLFCSEFGKDRGIFRYNNQPSLETEPIHINNDVIGFQAKFYTVNLSKRKAEIKKLIQDMKSKYSNLTILYFYSNQDWTFYSKEKDRKTNTQKDIENIATENGIKIEWKTNSYFESEFVTIENSNITQYFFDTATNDYYKKIKRIQPQSIELQDDDIFPTSLYIGNQEEPLIGKNTLSNFIITQLQSNELGNFSDIFIRGVAGIGKSTEMKCAYNELLTRCSSEDCYRDFHFLPTPYFFELKNYQEGCLKIDEGENPLLFLDGIDEIPNSKLIPFVNELKNLKSQNTSTRFVISGRDGAFIFEVNELKHIDVKLSFYIDSKLQNLLYRFKGTVFESFVVIPFYRNFICSSDFEKVKTYKDFITVLIESRLKIDKQKSDRSENVLSESETGMDLNKIQKTLAEFSYSLFKSAKRIFSITDLKKCFSMTEIVFLRKSCLFDYKNEGNISFFSNIYFEYFVARYYSEKRYSLIQTDLFISTGKPIVQYVNIIAILLIYISDTSKLYKKLSKQFNKETNAYILLTDYMLFPVKERYFWYKKIVDEFNTNKKLIYYGRFVQTHDLLRNIDSLSESLHNLLPEEFYDDAVKLHSGEISNFLKNPSDDKIISFENAVVLLGVYNKFWKENQQTVLKETAIPLISFFRENELAKTMEGLLSEDSIFNWYELYAWVTNWDEKEWNSFVEQVSSTGRNEFYSFKGEEEFRLKLKLFIHFHKNNYIRKLLVPLAIKILGIKNIDTDTAAFVPSSLDDEFKTPTIRFDNDISYFTYAIRDYDISISDLLLILNSCTCNYIQHSSSYQLEELYKEIINQFKNRIHFISDDEMPELYKLFVKYIEPDSGLYISDFSVYIYLLSDNQKTKLFTLLLNDLKQKEKWQNLWAIYRPIVMLLDIEDKKIAQSLFEELKNAGRVYNECIADIYISKLTEHPLYKIAEAEYPKLFPEQIKKERIRNKCVFDFEKNKQAMLDKEINVISNKEKLLDEINHILDYLYEHNESSEKGSDRKILLDLGIDYIGNKIRYVYEENYFVPPVFSSFAITYLLNRTDNSQNLDYDQAVENIEDWFSDEKYFWRYFFWLFICNYKKEETDTFLEKYPELVERIKTSMENEVPHFLEIDEIEIYDGGRNRHWVIPFVYYYRTFL